MAPSSPTKKRPRDGQSRGPANKKSKMSLPDDGGLQLLRDHGAKLAAEGGKTVFVGLDFCFFFYSIFVCCFCLTRFLQEMRWTFALLSVSLL